MDTYNVLIVMCVLTLLALSVISVLLWLAERRRARNTITSVTMLDTVLVPIKDGNRTTWMEVPR